MIAEETKAHRDVMKMSRYTVTWQSSDSNPGLSYSNTKQLCVSCLKVFLMIDKPTPAMMGKLITGVNVPKMCMCFNKDSCNLKPIKIHF